MGCPNPNCNGNLYVEKYYDWEYYIRCDTCPFHLEPIGFEDMVSSILKEAETMLANWLNCEAEFDVDWEQWEEDAWQSLVESLPKLSEHSEPHCKGYWESRGKVFTKNGKTI